MKKSVKIGFPIVCVGIIAITFGMMADIKNKAEAKNKEMEKEKSSYSENNSNEIKNKNDGLQIDNKLDNEISNSLVEKGELVETKINSVIDILKKKIYDNKNIDNIYFSIEGEENGKYIIAVRDAETTEAKQYYIIDLEKEEVEIYY